MVKPRFQVKSKMAAIIQSRLLTRLIWEINKVETYIKCLFQLIWACPFVWCYFWARLRLRSCVKVKVKVNFNKKPKSYQIWAFELNVTPGFNTSVQGSISSNMLCLIVNRHHYHHHSSAIVAHSNMKCPCTGHRLLCIGAHSCGRCIF